MGRTACCEKVGLRRGRWTAEEDEILRNYIQRLLRCGKSCRLRWINYLRSDLKRGNFTLQEEDMIVNLHASLGNRWCLIAGRTDNGIKNYWNSYLNRKIYTTYPQHNRPPVAPPAPGKQPGKRVSIKNKRNKININSTSKGESTTVIADGDDTAVVPMACDNQESATNTELEAMAAWPSIDIHDETDLFSGIRTVINEISTGSMDRGQISRELQDDIVKHDQDSLMMVGTTSWDRGDEEKANGGEMKMKETQNTEPCDHDGE